MMTKLILICAPSGTGKTTVARMLTATDNRFKHVQVLTTRKIRPNEQNRVEKVNVTLAQLKEMNEQCLLVNFNEKDGVYYGISHEAIANALNAGVYPVLEWDINKLRYWDDKFPVFKIILKPSSVSHVLDKLKDGRDPNGVRKVGVLKEIEMIDSNEVQGDITIVNYNESLMDTVKEIRKSLFK